MLKLKLFPALTFLLTISFFEISFSQGSKDQLYDWNKLYKSQAYGYSINVPESFHKEKGTRPHIDLKFVDDFGSSITVNVSPRQPEEAGITAYDYTKEFLEQSYKQGTPNATVTKTEKLMIAGEKAFIAEIEGATPNLKAMECYIYHGNLVFLITGMCENKRFENYKSLFRNCMLSLKFNLSPK